MLKRRGCTFPWIRNSYAAFANNHTDPKSFICNVQLHIGKGSLQAWCDCYFKSYRNKKKIPKMVRNWSIEKIIELIKNNSWNCLEENI